MAHGRSKASAQYLHAKKRALERYGVVLDKESYLALCKEIQDGKHEYLGKQSLRLTVWKIAIKRIDDTGTEWVTSANVVYDKTRHRIVTFLPVGITDAKGVAIKVEP